MRTLDESLLLSGIIGRVRSRLKVGAYFMGRGVRLVKLWKFFLQVFKLPHKTVEFKIRYYRRIFHIIASAVVLEKGPEFDDSLLSCFFFHKKTKIIKNEDI